MIRELDAGNAARSAITRGFEWIAKVSGYNRGRAGRHYRPAREIVAQLTQCGLFVRGARRFGGHAVRQRADRRRAQLGRLVAEDLGQDR